MHLETFKTWLDDWKLIPTKNILLPPQIIYPSKVQHYVDNPSKILPKGIISDSPHKFPGWKHIGSTNPNPDYPLIYVTDGVHRILSQIKMGKKNIQIKIEKPHWDTE